MTRVLDAVKGAIVKAWSALVLAVRSGALRSVLVFGLVLSAAVSYGAQEYGAACANMLMVIWLEISDPRRPAGILVRRKR